MFDLVIPAPDGAENIIGPTATLHILLASMNSGLSGGYRENLVVSGAVIIVMMIVSALRHHTTHAVIMFWTPLIIVLILCHKSFYENDYARRIR